MLYTASIGLRMSAAAARVACMDLGIAWTAVGSVGTVASVLAAWYATRSARAAQQGELEAGRIRDLENRISQQKYETYKPMLDYIGNIFSQQQSEESRKAVADKAAVRKTLLDFSRWIVIYGSDEALRAYHNLFHGMTYDAPWVVQQRLMADFFLAARRDIGFAGSKAQQSELLTVALRLNDFYNQGDLTGKVMRLPLKRALKKAGWSPPWSSMNSGLPKPKDANSGTDVPTLPTPRTPAPLADSNDPACGVRASQGQAGC